MKRAPPSPPVCRRSFFVGGIFFGFLHIGRNADKEEEAASVFSEWLKLAGVD